MFVRRDAVFARLSCDLPGKFSGKVLLTRYVWSSTLGFPIPARFSRKSRPEVTHGHLYTHQPGLLRCHAGALGSTAKSQADHFKSEVARRMGRGVGATVRQCGYRRCKPFGLYGGGRRPVAATSAGGGV